MTDARYKTLKRYEAKGILSASEEIELWIEELDLSKLFSVVMLFCFVAIMAWGLR